MQLPIPMRSSFFFLDVGTEFVAKYIKYFVDYHPYHNGRNPKFDDYSALILDFKNGRQSTALLFAILINKYFDRDWDNCCCVVVPSSDSQKTFTPVHDLVRILVSIHPGLQNGSDVLVRTKTISKLAKGGNRDISVHLGSIDINQNSSINISGKGVLLIDDVMTTGNSLLACESKLIDAGAKRVFLLTLAKTV